MRLPHLSSLTQGLRATLARFPVPALSAIMVAASLVLAVEFDDKPDPLQRIALLAGLFFVASLLIDLTSEALASLRNKRWLYTAIALGAVCAYGIFIVPSVLKDACPPFWYSHFILLFVLHLGIALVPLGATKEPRALWRLNMSLFLRFFFSSVNAALLYAGLALAIVSIDKLFNLKIDDEIYLQLWFACAFTAQPLLFLGGIPQIATLDEYSKFPKPLRFSLRFIALPLVALYLLILYAYVGKMALQWSWPDGWVAMPIFILAVVGLLTFVLSLPLSKTETWATLYHKWLFRALIPLSAVLFLALQVRLGEYGMTINRYLGLALAVWLFGLSLAHIIRPRLHVGWVPCTLLAISLFSIYAGPVGAFAWSQRSQTERITSLAQQVGALKDGQLVPASGSPDSETVKSFRSCLRYIFENFGPNALEAELRGFHQANPQADLESRQAYVNTDAVLAYLKLDSSINRSVNYNYSGALPTFAHNWQITNNSYQGRHTRRFKSPHGEISIIMDDIANKLNISLDGKAVGAIDTSSWAGKIIDVVDKKLQEEPLAWHLQENNWRFSLVLIRARIERKESKINQLQYSLFYTPPAADEKEQSPN